ncbi:MAG TPA: hypothetical protein VKT81_06665, partial [Bryobacteraceae bacterium]|nr:hypothetical protein [Bryobacteraceae bacterium]
GEKRVDGVLNLRQILLNQRRHRFIQKRRDLGFQPGIDMLQIGNIFQVELLRGEIDQRLQVSAVQQVQRRRCGRADRMKDRAVRQRGERRRYRGILQE